METMATVVRTKADYRSPNKPTWCPGCGDFAVLDAITRALASLNVDPAKLAVISGIGCSSRLPIFLNAYGFHSVHGRALPVATGVKLANPELTVLVVGGDGDGLAIGAGHTLHAARRNVDVTYIMMDNSIYGLTKGQASPTSQPLLKTGTTPFGNLDQPMNPVMLALAVGATFVARGFAARVEELAGLIQQGIEHRGFSFIHALSPCVTFNNTFKSLAERVTPLPTDHDITNRGAALQRAVEPGHLYLGVFYKVDKAGIYDRIQTITGGAEASRAELRRVMEQFA